MKNEMINRWARRSAVLAVAAIPFASFVGSSEADPAPGLAGSWNGGGWVSFSNGKKEKARCRAHYTGGGSAYTVTATCATSAGKASQTAKVYKVSGTHYKGSFFNSEYNVRGSIRVTVNGTSQNVSLSGDGTSAQLNLSRR
ncbi:conserved exported protein of unknown function [Hyphomicrobium sp. 1Nfss2.1]|uniref:hypothetical protein n=1 Tax=Hyphomicrobium sp. 1Nfss2.1 TaxID=3413936 RepID=UPI003C7BF1CA